MTTFFQGKPPGWRRVPLKYLIEGSKNGAWGGEAGTDQIDCVCVRVADFDWLRLRLDLSNPTIRSFGADQFRQLELRQGDLVIEKSGGGEKTPVGRVVMFSGEGPSVTSNFVARVRPNRSICPRFLLYLLVAQYMSGFSVQFVKQNTGIQNLDDAALFRSDVWIPDRANQIVISDFLDRETAHIDQLIEKKQRLVEMLAAKQEAIRDIATCKGLNPDVSYKNSGVDWFGDVPAHWIVCRFNRLIASKVDYRGRTPEKVDDGVFLVTARNIRTGRIDYERSQEFTTVHDWEKLSARGKPEIGDVVITTEAPLGQVAQVDRLDVAFAQRIMKFRANKKFVSNDFLAQFMMSASFQRSLQLYASGSTASGIKSERLAHLFGLVPPADEQSKITESVRAEIERLNAVVAPVKKSIERLREFRAALVTSTVTGQIKVADWHRRGSTDRRLDEIQESMRA